MIKKTLSCIFILLICGVVLFGCKHEEKEKAPLSPSEESDESRAIPPSGDIQGDSIIASVNGIIITRSEVDNEKKNLVRQFQGKIPPEQMEAIEPKLWNQALENLINRRLMVLEAEKENIHADQKAIDDQIASISSRFPDTEKFWEQLAMMGISEEKLRKDIEQNLRIETLLKDKIDQFLEVSEKDIEDYYQNHQENFKPTERIKASHILIKIDPQDGPEEKEKKRQELGRLKEEIENGADFAELARDHSDCPSKTRGGDLGLFERGRMVKPFEDAAFQLKVGEISDIVESPFGYHLIKLTDRQEGETIPFEKARDQIIASLKHQKKNQAINDYILKLRNEAKIIYSEGIQP